MQKLKLYIKNNFKIENKPGLYLTIIVHLIALIVFLCISISSAIKPESSFVLDFTKQEELEKEIKKQKLEESVSKELDALLSQSGKSKIRNTTVNSSDLKDDRHKNAKSIYEDARKLQEKINANKALDEELNNEDYVATKTQKTNKSKEKYSGPSVLSWRLDKRKALSLPIPAYKCEGAGIVKVAIIVNKKGYVKATKIIEGQSSNDDCLRQYAIKAAKKSRFNSSSNANDRQAGEIIYNFVAQ